MALIYRCDGCKTDFTSHDELGEVTVPYTNQYDNEFSTSKGSRDSSGDSKEYCITCVKAIKQAIAGLKGKF